MPLVLPSSCDNQKQLQKLPNATEGQDPSTADNHQAKGMLAEGERVEVFHVFKQFGSALPRQSPTGRRACPKQLLPLWAEPSRNIKATETHTAGPGQAG